MRSLKWSTEPGQGYTRLYKTVTPLPVRQWGGWSSYLSSIPSRASGVGWRMRYRSQNAWWDFKATWSGYCNASLTAGSGGYSHWRCAERAQDCDAPAPTKHRYRNYTWVDGERAKHDPIDRMPSQRGIPDRHMVPTRRQARAIRQLYGKAVEQHVRTPTVG